MEKQRILYICTGNIYRSRYAEAFTNHLAKIEQLNIEAFSRGLATHLVTECISPYTLARLTHRGISESLTSACRQAISDSDFEDADIIIALKEVEHRPMIEARFPDRADRVCYWHVSDLDEWESDQALDAIESKVLELIQEIS